MSEPTPNPAQDELITSTDGIYKVDAGAGTGKTFAVTRRYGTIVGQDGIDPSDVLLVTFTENAATEMKERIVGHAPYKMRELADAPIQTFHSLAHDLLDEHGAAAPTLIGIDGYISGSTTIVDNELIEAQLFADFFDRFSASHPEYESFLGVVDDPTALLSEIKKLAAKGVFPTADGWYRSGEAALDGDFEAFESLFAEQNAPRNSGNKQSKLRAGLTEYGDGGLHTPDAPPKHEIRGTGKQIPAEIAELVFEEDRRELKSFVHDLYFEYLEFAVERNYLNFAFLQLFAFVLLCENHALRASIAYEYVMIDEFQDTSEIQFKLALLLSSGANFCVVGDWKQSIYSFQYAAVENLTAFADRIAHFRSDLNDSHRRVDISDADIAALETISLTKNYRSTQSILDFSSHAFSTPATSSESHSPQSVESLRADKAADDSRIEAFQHAEEHDALLTKIEALVGNPDYAIQTADGSRVPTYDDIAVFTRTRSFGRELLERAEAASVPMAYEGGVELFRSAPAKLLLAWLRIVEYDVDRGWAPILERAGYAMGDIEAILERGEYPDAMETFRESLAELETIAAVARRVFNHYGYRGAYADVLVDTIQSMHAATTLTRGDVISLIERGIDEGSTHEVTTAAGVDSVTVQTIHAAKGLEYPIVILANMNQGAFPPRGGDSHEICYADPIGLRQRSIYGTHHDQPYSYGNWRMDVLSTVLPREYDEERRLLYVAMTRAESHLLFAAGDEPNTFLEELPVDIATVEPDLAVDRTPESTQTSLQLQISAPVGPTKYTPHSLMEEIDISGGPGRGKAFGTMVHNFAEAYARGEAVSPSNADEETIKEYLDECGGTLRIEEDVYLPVTVAGEQVIISGIADLIHVMDDRVEIIDYKTVTERTRESEYRKQLSVYYHVVKDAYPDREVTAGIFYTNTGAIEWIEPLSIADVESVLEAQVESE